MILLTDEEKQKLFEIRKELVGVVLEAYVVEELAKLSTDVTSEKLAVCVCRLCDAMTQLINAIGGELDD